MRLQFVVDVSPSFLRRLRDRRRRSLRVQLLCDVIGLFAVGFPLKALWAPSNCSATKCRRPEAKQDLCVEVRRQHTVDRDRATCETFVSVTHRHVPVALRGEHHRDDNNWLGSLSDHRVGDLVAPTLAGLTCPVPCLQSSPPNIWRCQSLWRNDHDPTGASCVKECHVVSSNQAIMLALRIGPRGGMAQDDPGCLDW